MSNKINMHGFLSNRRMLWIWLIYLFYICAMWHLIEKKKHRQWKPCSNNIINTEEEKDFCRTICSSITINRLTRVFWTRSDNYNYPNYGIFTSEKIVQLYGLDSTWHHFGSKSVLRKCTFPLFYSHPACCLIPQLAIMSDLLHSGLLPNLLFDRMKKVITPAPPELGASLYLNWSVIAWAHEIK